MKTVKNISALVGNTPLLELVNLEKAEKLSAKIFAKLEYLNPTGSVKDRAALGMLNDAEARGVITKGATIIEPTSGNTGIGLAAIGTSRGYRVILTMPSTMSVERRNLLKAYGAEVVLTDGELGMKGAIDKAKELNAEIKNSFIPDQFSNPSNPKAHYDTTAKEIFEDTCGNVDFFVAGVGSGGTITGIGRFFKDNSPKTKVVAVEPLSSPVLSKGIAGAHKIQGIGANFVPANFDRSICDEIICVSNEDAFKYAKFVAKSEGILVGISSGAALSAAINLAKRKENEGKNIVVLFPDSADRYYSTPLFCEE